MLSLPAPLSAKSPIASDDCRDEVEPAALAKAAGLRYVSDKEPGIRRLSRGDKFSYRTADGAVLRDEKTLTRIRQLAIPPAYKDIWICANANGHLQATGRDARGRKQYRYHAKWRQHSDHRKYHRLLEFGQRLPKLRAALKRDLALRQLSREKVLAIVVSLLATTLIRVGNEEYARSNRSFGLTTLRNRHAQFLSGGRARLKFRGKSGQEHEVALGEPRLVRLLRRCHELPGQQLFQYLDDAGDRHAIDSEMVNAYLRESMGEDFSAKDFRTWAGTTRALILMCSLPVGDTDSARKAAIKLAIQQVASELGNTPAVCRSSYIHPGVFEAWARGALAKESICGDERRRERAALRILAREIG